MQHCFVHVFEGRAYIPTQAETDVGYYVDVEPVEVSALLDTKGLEAAIKRTMDRGYPRVASAPTHGPGSRKKSIVFEYTNAKSVKKFERTSICWLIEEFSDGAFAIKYVQKTKRGAHAPVFGKDGKLPLGTSLDSAIKRFVEIIQNPPPELAG